MADEILALSIPPICSAELLDLEREAGRPLSPQQALRYRLRRLKKHLVAAMLEAFVGAK